MQIIQRMAKGNCKHYLQKVFNSGFASSAPIRIDVDDTSGIAILSLNRPPVNILNLEMLKALTSSIKEIEANKSRGMILTSTSNSVFAAGMDLTILHKPDRERLKELYAAFQDSWLALYGTDMATAAAINGHSPGGGCVYCTCCEYRVMLPNFTIGLSDINFDMILPKYITDTLATVVSKRTAELALLQGKMFSTEEALMSGLIDEVASNKEEALDKCTRFIQSFAKVDPVSRSLTKKQFRSEILEELLRDKEEDLEKFVGYITRAEMQNRLELYMDEIKKRKNKD